LYQHCEGVGVFAFSVDSREPLWEALGAERFVARAEDRVVMTGSGGDVLFVDNSTGHLEKRLGLPGDVLVVENRRDGVLYFVSTDGRMLCAKPAGFPYLRREEVAAARSTLHRGLIPDQDEGEAAGEVTTGTGGVSARQAQDPLRSDGGRR
jgi:hypothetical protein